MEEAARSAFSASLALVAGYAFIRLSYYRRFSAECLRADRFALHILGYSFFLFVLGDVAATFIPYWTPRRLQSAEADLAAIGIKHPVINAIFFGMAAAVCDNIRVRLLMRKNVALLSGKSFVERIRIAAVARFVGKSNDSALRVMFRATIFKKPVMVTLQSGKVYVGKPFLSLWEDPTQALTFIKILPSKSGYRDPVTKKVTLGTRYDELLNERLVEIDEGIPRDDAKDATDPLTSDVLGLINAHDEIVAHVDIEDMGVVISWSQLESLTIYDEDLYIAFQAQDPPPSTSATHIVEPT
jgi:hypothetical protein